ncbi:MAG: nitroreductase family protein [Syntrophobacteraceae bacterium]|nr:nitroreductase family protein [Syntrophobacteraceae bacterium]
MSLFDVDPQSCIRDGICAAVCPMGIIDFEKGAYPTPNAAADELCIRCGHCVAVCPTGSLSHRDMPVDQCPSVRKELELNPEHCEHFLRSRRSIRTYKDQPVSRAEITKLIEMARYAPSGHNTQCAEWLVVDNRDEVRKLTGIVAEWMRWMLANEPEIAQSLHMDITLKRYEKGTDVILRDAPVVLVAHAPAKHRLGTSSCLIALSYLDLAAPSLGLGTCWAGYFNASATIFPPMQQALALPDGHQAFGSMMLGYPKFSYQRLPTRKAPAIVWR